MKCRTPCSCGVGSLPTRTAIHSHVLGPLHFERHGTDWCAQTKWEPIFLRRDDHNKANLRPLRFTLLGKGQPQ